jgi:nucleotide-binding universal stress UspA family protein
MRSGPVIIGFDGTQASAGAVREAAALLAPRPALAVVVWEAGRNFEVATLPEQVLEPSATIDVRGALQAEMSATEEAQRLAAQGAALAREAGLEADGMAVADDVTVADTLIRLARELDAQAVVIGGREHHGLTRRGVGSTLAGLLHGAPCPVLVCGTAQADAR